MINDYKIKLTIERLRCQMVQAQKETRRRMEINEHTGKSEPLWRIGGEWSTPDREPLFWVDADPNWGWPSPGGSA